MNKKYNVILDAILLFLLKRNAVKGNFEKLQGEFEGDDHKNVLKKYMSNDLKLEYWQIDLILEFLCKEKLIVEFKYDSKNVTVIKLTLEGVLFIENGGYQKLQFDLCLNRAIKCIEIFAVIVGGLFAAAYYFRELFLL